MEVILLFKAILYTKLGVTFSTIFDNESEFNNTKKLVFNMNFKSSGAFEFGNVTVPISEIAAIQFIKEEDKK